LLGFCKEHSFKRIISIFLLQIINCYPSNHSHPLHSDIFTILQLPRVIITSMTNHLVHESSPYLLQHAENPVDWYPWGKQALEKANLEQKPIFLSIGYAACHWCHVMAHESFEDSSIAALLNANFVSIKVDREERPDLDSIYMNFIIAISGQGGWPMNIFLTPEGKPFYGGTYFPPTRRQNLPSFYEVLKTIIRLWITDRESILSSSEQLVKSLQPHSPAQSETQALSHDLLQQVTKTITSHYSWQGGGWGTAPKFPQPMLLEFLLRQATRHDKANLDLVVHACQAMAQGGMYDVLAGGFARYSVNPTWLIPHFEKMLYDNALLALLYLHVYQLTHEGFFRQVCESTLDFVLRELTHPEGGFFSSLDADSEGEEGKFYLWTPQQIHEALPQSADADLFITAYGVSPEGNFEGSNILHRTLTDEQLAQQFNLPPEAVSSWLTELRQRLLLTRNSRPRPNTDDKVLISWNALMLTALAEAAGALSRSDYLEAAVKNARFILENLYADGKLLRSWRHGVAKQSAFLEDYAGLAHALLSLYQVDPVTGWYQTALELQEHILEHFSDPTGGFFDTPSYHEPLLIRPKDQQDNATPSGNALTAMLLLKLATYQGNSAWRQLAEAMLSSNLDMMLRYPSAFAQWWCAADFALGPVNEVAILGSLSEKTTQALLEPLWQGYSPRLILAASIYPPVPGSPALLQDRPLLNGLPTAYVCQGFVCQQPINDPQAMLAQLKSKEL
jgi:uncharacterized protein YyaL (SSP411 family)